MSDVVIRPATAADFPAWGALRARLWSESPGHVSAAEDMRPAIDATRPACAFLALEGEGVIGFVEVALRHEYVNGAESSPVGFIEGWYVDEAHQGRGIGRALMRAAEEWTLAQGVTELCSEAILDADESHAAHRACGFEETGRVVCFRKPLE